MSVLETSRPMSVAGNPGVELIRKMGDASKIAMMIEEQETNACYPVVRQSSSTE